MFQSFRSSTSPDNGRARITALRERFEAMNVDAVLVPRADEFQGEYVPASAERLAWLTGFTGSAGMALVLRERALVFVDGRYTTQLAEQVDPAVFEAANLIDEPPSCWIETKAPAGLRLGIDPWLHTPREVERLRTALEAVEGDLVLLDANPVDAIWTDRPAAPAAAIVLQPDANAGRSAADKIADMREIVRDKKAQACLFTDPSSVAWLLNIRGNDVPHTPHPLARAILPLEGKPTLFVEALKLDGEAKDALQALVEIREPGEFLIEVRELGEQGRSVLADPALTPHACIEALRENGGKLVEGTDPARLPRAVKNEAECDGARSVHRQDGVAVTNFLAWLDRQEAGSVDEITAAKRLEQSRSEIGRSMQMPLRDISFDTISGAGPHAALPHYRVDETSNRTLDAGELYLVDSGGQYTAGTTDITRTVAVGAPNRETIAFFTRVLKGMIAITRLRFPAGTRGVDIDAFARTALWQAGADYAHGTGHGVGSYLSVHEGPQTISRRGMQELIPGMIVSNEPGYYREGAFGIRIENLLLVHEPREIPGGDKPMLGFETLTLAPIDRRLVDPDLLSEAERAWLDAYHARVQEELAPLIDDEQTRAWLDRATAPLSAS
ncbi:aminopeptidase P family protein [Pararhizobium mangrovi]|uniref:Aminopeptidase P family protein n=1 Tax=Pararhizobium mangrovi TaxID=2590452 RepID=A0A506UAE6_9HYPH|nr:aminopeptidase P family protein [Pararhizobium mangrovi]TPW29559.1 aminopeptidase P family protein [Pararhizobium mangrovi]